MQTNTKNLNKKLKAQAAMEYLLVYAWAMLIIAIVFAALFYIGIFSPSFFMPRAQPGSCYVIRESTGPMLYGACYNFPPEYAPQFSNSTSKGGLACANASISGINTSTRGINTAVFWMYWNGTLNESPLGFEGYFLWISPNKCFGFTTGNGDNYGISASGIANRWVMVAAEFYNGPYATNSTLYINGQQAGATQCLGSAHTGMAKTDFLIGSSTGSKYKFTGVLTNIQLYNTSLSASDIKELYEEGIGGKPIDLQHLVAWWPLNGNANDYSGFFDNLNTSTKCSISYSTSYPTGYPA